MKPLPLILVSAIAAACTQAAPAPQRDLAAEEAAIRAVDARWLDAARSRDAAGVAAVVASDGVMYRDHVEPMVGPAAFEAYQAKWWADNPQAGVSWTTDAIEVVATGDLAIQTGTYQDTGLGAAGDGEDRGRFVTVWKKVDGEWKVAHDIGNSTMPEAPPS